MQLIAMALVLGLASPVLGCLNDRETAAAEQEFRSRYESAENPGAGKTPERELSTSAVSTRYVWSGGALAAGALGLGLTVLAVRRQRRA